MSKKHTTAKPKTQNLLTVSIADLAGKPQGANEDYLIDMKLSIDDEDIRPKSNLKGTINVMKIDGEFNVELKKMEIDLEMTCDKCLEPYTQKIKIPHAERQYAMDMPEREFRDMLKNDVMQGNKELSTKKTNGVAICQRAKRAGTEAKQRCQIATQFSTDKVDKAERVFQHVLREEIAYVNMKTKTIDITDFLREEIILHFPLVSVCSTHCPGIKLKNNV